MATTEIYTLSLHDALPIFRIDDQGQIAAARPCVLDVIEAHFHRRHAYHLAADRKSTRLNSSHVRISYAVFCLKKKIRRQRLPTTSFLRFRIASVSTPSTRR